MQPEDFAIFRKENAMISLSCPKKAKDNDNMLMFMSGAIFNKQINKMDWDNRINIKLGVTDLGSLLYGFMYNKPVSIYHQYEDLPSKTINLTFDNSKITLRLSEKSKDGVVKQVFANINESEFAILRTLIEKSIIKMIKWE